MVQTKVTPNKANLDISVMLPDSYVGKEVHILFYIDDEVKDSPVSISPKRRPSEFAGTLSKSAAAELLKDIEQSRNEWE